MNEIESTIFDNHEDIGYRYKWFLNIMRQNTNLIQAWCFFHRNGSVWGNFCIYSRIDCIKYEIKMIPFNIRSLSPTINIAYGANFKFEHRLTAFDCTLLWLGGLVRFVSIPNSVLQVHADYVPGSLRRRHGILNMKQMNLEWSN